MNEILAHAAYLTAECGARNIKFFEDGWCACTIPFLYTQAIVTSKVGDRVTWYDRWCYHDGAAAAAALEEWDGKGEPEGWHRHPASGRRREADQEYVRF